MCGGGGGGGGKERERVKVFRVREVWGRERDVYEMYLCVYTAGVLIQN